MTGCHIPPVSFLNNEEPPKRDLEMFTETLWNQLNELSRNCNYSFDQQRSLTALVEQMQKSIEKITNNLAHLQEGRVSIKDLQSKLSTMIEDKISSSRMATGEEKTKDMSFGEALEHMKKGKHLYREGWNKKDMQVCFKNSLPGVSGFYTYPCIDNFDCYAWVPSTVDLLKNDWALRQVSA